MLVLGGLLGVAAMAGQAQAQPGPASVPVLTPDVAPQVEAAFARAEPTFRLQDAHIHPQRVDARVCRADGTCLDLTLTLPQAACAGHALTTWCVQFPQGTPLDGAVLLRALEVPSLWSPPPPRRGPHATVESPALQILPKIALFFAPLLAFVLLLAALRPRLLAHWPQERVWLLAVWFALGDVAWHAWNAAQDGIWGLSTATWLAIWWLAPVSAGGAVGLLFRWGLARRPMQRWSAWLPLALMPAAGGLLAVLSRRVGAMDGAAMALLATLTWLAVAHQRFARLAPWLLALGSLTASLLLLEVAARLVLPPPPVIEWHTLSLLNRDSPRPDARPVGAGDLLVHCALHAEIGDETSRCLRLEQPPPHQRWVLHLGDSMVFGSGVEAKSALPAQIAALRPELGHLNAGVPGTSIDTELALLLRILPLHRPDLVMLYAMPGNDADEVAAPTESCGGQSPLVFDGPTPHLRCPQPIWAPRPWHGWLLQSRLPLPIAALTNVSFVARHLEWLHRLTIEAPRAHEREPPHDAQLYARYFAALVATLRDAQVPLQIVVMPLRRSQYVRFTEPRRKQLLDVLRTANAPILDAQAPLDSLVLQQGEPALYVDEPRGDIHLNPHGLAELAAYIAPRLALPQALPPTQ
jgi:hypothetical protein